MTTGVTVMACGPFSKCTPNANEVTHIFMIARNNRGGDAKQRTIISASSKMFIKAEKKSVALSQAWQLIILKLPQRHLFQALIGKWFTGIWLARNLARAIKNKMKEVKHYGAKKQRNRKVGR
ncbi:MAG TPA: hypothetical protein VIE89_06210 [Candidatus Binatia bacterium]